jgi:hypothetical protein
MPPLIILAALAATLPTMDLPNICRKEGHGLPADQQASAYQDCLHDEGAALQELQRHWTEFPAGSRNTCAGLGRMIFSYVETLTCIEIQVGHAEAPDARPAAPAPSLAPQAAPAPTGAQKP